jgi:hypothetical protein
MALDFHATDNTNIHIHLLLFQSFCESGMYPKHHDKIIKLGLEEVPYLPNLTLTGVT